MFLKKQKTYIYKTIKHWWNKSKKTQIDEEINNVQGLNWYCKPCCSEPWCKTLISGRRGSHRLWPGFWFGLTALECKSQRFCPWKLDDEVVHFQEGRLACPGISKMLFHNFILLGTGQKWWVDHNSERLQQLPEDTVSPNSLRSGYNFTFQRQLRWPSSAQSSDSVVQSSFSASRWGIYIKIGVSGILRSWEYFYKRMNNIVDPYLNGISCSR